MARIFRTIDEQHPAELKKCKLNIKYVLRLTTLGIRGYIALFMKSIKLRSGGETQGI